MFYLIGIKVSLYQLVVFFIMSVSDSKYRSIHMFKVTICASGCACRKYLLKWAFLCENFYIVRRRMKSFSVVRARFEKSTADHRLENCDEVLIRTIYGCVQTRFFSDILYLCEVRKFCNDPASRWAILQPSDLLTFIDFSFWLPQIKSGRIHWNLICES